MDESPHPVETDARESGLRGDISEAGLLLGGTSDVCGNGEMLARFHAADFRVMPGAPVPGADDDRPSIEHAQLLQGVEEFDEPLGKAVLFPFPDLTAAFAGKLRWSEIGPALLVPQLFGF